MDYLDNATQLNGDYLAVAAHFEDLYNSKIDVGAVYLYKGNGAAFVQITQVSSMNPVNYEYFGSFVFKGAMGNNH